VRTYFVALGFLLAVGNTYGFGRNVSSFHAIASSGIAQVKVPFGQNCRVAANIPEPYLALSVKTGTLFIETRPGLYGPVEFWADVYMPSVDNWRLAVWDSGALPGKPL
jgi:hypothetical protein